MTTSPSPHASPPHTSPPWSTTTKAIVAVVALVLTALLIWRFRALIPPLVVAALIAYLLHPLVTFVDVRTRLTRSQTVLLVYFIFALVFFAGFTVVGYIAVDQVLILAANLPDWFARAVTLAAALPNYIPDRIVLFNFPIDLSPLRAQFQEQLNAFVTIEAIMAQILDLLEPIFSRGSSLAATIVTATVNFLGLAFLVFVLSIYIANDIPRFGRLISDLAHQPGYRQDADRLMADIARIWAAYFRGQVILGVVIFFVVSIVLSILGVNNALGLGLLSGVMEFLPVIGPLIGAGAAILVAFFQNTNPWGLSPLTFALVVTVAMFLVQQLENSVLVPRIVGEALDLHPLLVMVSVIMGASLAGLLGAILAAPVVATIKLLGGYAWRKMLDLPPFPLEEEAPPPAEPSPLGVRLRRLWDQAVSRVEGVVPDYPTRTERSQRAEQSHREEGKLMDAPIYPLQFRPVFKDYPWGGRNLETVLGREIPDGVVAESWEISAHPNGQTTVADGPLAGKTLGDVQALLGEDLVGSRNRRALELDKFPLLIKLLDANRWLSVQVHPDDEYGLAHEGEFGKTEMWVVLHAEPGAELIYGLKKGVDREAFVRAVDEERSQDLLHRVPVQAGDVIFVPAGAVHSLGPGIIVAEIQQNSDTTYRIYDWGRMGNDGKPRPLHIEQALAVIDWSCVEPEPVTPRVISAGSRGIHQEVIGLCDYFRTERFHMEPGSSYADRCAGDSFQIWGVLSGQTALSWDGEPLTLDAISWVLLPAALGEYRVEAKEASTLLRVITPERAPT